MKKRLVIHFILLILLILVSFFLTSKNIIGGKGQSDLSICCYSKQGSSPATLAIYDELRERDFIRKNRFIRQKSGPVKIVPWEYNEEFKAAKIDNNTPFLMAAYCTVLKDPLPGEEYNVHLAAKKLAGTLLKPGQIFSQNNLLGPYNEAKGYRIGPTYIGSRLTTTVGGGVCKISSTLYNVSILSNMEIVERHPHSMPVPYVPYGQDATVAYGAKDFKFRNNLEFPVLIWAQGIDNILYIGFYGLAEPPTIQWHHETIKSYQAPVIYKTNTTLGPDEKKVILEGMDGAIVNSWVTIHNKDGSITEKSLGKSYYNPMPHIVEKGS